MNQQTQQLYNIIEENKLTLNDEVYEDEDEDDDDES